MVNGLKMVYSFKYAISVFIFGTGLFLSGCERELELGLSVPTSTDKNDTSSSLSTDSSGGTESSSSSSAGGFDSSISTDAGDTTLDKGTDSQKRGTKFL
jgi:hypothetical protein